MFTLTIKEFMDREDFSDIPGIPCIYVVRDIDTILYIGKSTSIFNRIWQHFGHRQSPSDLGRLIIENMPQSEVWQIDLLVLEDCKHYTVFEARVLSADIAELDLIKLLSPCLNRMSNHSVRLDRLSKYKLPWDTRATWPDSP